VTSRDVADPYAMVEHGQAEGECERPGIRSPGWERRRRAPRCRSPPGLTRRFPMNSARARFAIGMCASYVAFCSGPCRSRGESHRSALPRRTAW
jgi:hypothetical protein